MEDEEENRPVPDVVPYQLFEGSSQLWGYPWKGLDGTRAVIATLKAADCLAPWAAGLEKLGEALDAYEQTDETIVGADAYQLEYTRLFIGSFKMYAPPYVSYYTDGENQVYGPTTVEIEDLYAQFGIELSADEHDMPDHIRFLLAFLGMLAKSYEVKGNVEFAYAYADFKEAYLDPWTGQFAANINEYAQFPFFKELVAFTLSVL